MSRAQDCSGCMWGDHERHDPSHGLIEGLIGGEHCACTGDCAERAAVTRERMAAQFTPTATVATLPARQVKDRQVLIDMLIGEVQQDCTCLMFDKGPHRRGCSTMERAENLADDILLVLRPSQA